MSSIMDMNWIKNTIKDKRNGNMLPDHLLGTVPLQPVAAAPFIYCGHFIYWVHAKDLPVLGNANLQHELALHKMLMMIRIVGQ